MDYAGDIQNWVDNFFLTFRSFKYSKLSHLSLQMKDEQRHGTLQLSQLSITIFLKQNTIFLLFSNIRSATLFALHFNSNYFQMPLIQIQKCLKDANNIYQHFLDRLKWIVFSKVVSWVSLCTPPIEGALTRHPKFPPIISILNQKHPKYLISLK